MWEGILRRKANLIIPAASYSYFPCSSLALFILARQLAGQTDHVLYAKHRSQHIFWASLFGALRLQCSSSMANACACCWASDFLVECNSDKPPLSLTFPRSYF